MVRAGERVTEILSEEAPHSMQDAWCRET